MPDILGLRTTIYKVPDIESAREWYARAFGQRPYFDEPFYVGFNIAGYELGLLPSADVGHKSDNILSYRGVEDIERAYREFLSQGAAEHRKPQNVGGEIVTASVLDPWGNVIGLIYNPEFSLS